MNNLKDLNIRLLFAALGLHVPDLISKLTPNGNV